MLRNLRNTIVSLLATATLLLVPLATPAFASAAASGANIDNNLCGGATLSTNSTDCNTVATNGTTTINSIISTIINVFSLVVGVVAVIMIIVGGFRYITSGGDSNNISGAKTTIIYAIIGLVIVALAQFIVYFVLGKVAGATT